MAALSLEAFPAAAGATIVTPNKRLARELAARFDRAQIAAGRSAWAAPQVLPWGAFVADAWQRALDAELPLPARRLDATQCAHMWHRIVAHALRDAPLVDAADATRLAVEAWERVHAYGAGTQSWRAFGEHGLDPAMFARWADAFVRASASLDALDGARAADALAACRAALARLGLQRIALTGFLDVTPQQRRLLDAFASAGIAVDFEQPPTDAMSPRARVVAADSPRDELCRALGWARERALRDPQAKVAIVVLDLARRAPLVRTLAEEALCPQLQWPGFEEARRPYEIAAPQPLDQCASIDAALTLIALAHGPVDAASVATLLRAPDLPDAGEQWHSRARLERLWLDQGRRLLSLTDVVDALMQVDAELAARWGKLAGTRLRKRMSPRAWVEAWRRWLEDAGWGEGRTRASSEFQAHAAWNALLVDFARIGAVHASLSGSEALSALRRATAARLFEPQGGDAQVEILGALEAAGLAFDAMWVAGMDAEAWPPAPSPNPLLPLAWQRAHGVARCDAARELEYAKRVTCALSHGAAEVVFSYARNDGDHACAPSALLVGVAPLDPPSPSPATAATLYELRPALERVADLLAPRPAPGTKMRGGAGLIDAQSKCPFKAVALHRLRARAWPESEPGLSALEHGTLLHAALDRFWREVRDRAALDRLGEQALEAAIERAVAAAEAELASARRASIAHVVQEVEHERLASVLRQWVRDVERSRAPFSVIATERKCIVPLAGITLEVKIDRIDALGEDRCAIIDYKSGEVDPPARWLDARPLAPQLALYARALAQQGDAPVPGALVYAQLKTGRIGAIGVAEHGARWAGLTSANDLSSPDWQTLLARLDAGVVALGEEIAAGHAPVAPRDAGVCGTCHLQPMCRIASTGERAEPAESHDGNGGEDA